MLVSACLAIVGGAVAAEDPLPVAFRGEWVPAAESCASPIRFHVAADRVTLINGADRATYGDVAIAHSFFGREYDGITVAAIPEFSSGDSPFTVFFNHDEVAGRTALDIFHEVTAGANPRLAAIQAAARRLAGRFPLNMVPLKKCR